jgi:probable HAF family extracellular repeat protein
MSIRSVVASVRDCLFVTALFAGSAAYAADFTPLGAVPDSTSLGSAANAVSADGRTIAGTSDVYGGSNVVRWRNDIGPLILNIVSSSTRVTSMSATGEEIIGNLGWSTTGSFYWSSLTGPILPMVLPGYSNSTANAISADGSMMVGAVYNSGYPNSNWGAVRWSRTYISSFSSYNYFVGLGYLPGGSNSFSNANAVSGDGTVIVGSSTSVNAEREAFRWTEATGMVGLGFLPGGTGSEANFVSGDGRVIVGSVNFSYDPSRNAAFRWTEETGMTDLGGLPSAVVTIPRAMSRDGRFVVGLSGDWNLGAEAFRWSETGGIVSLGGLPGAQMSFAIGVSDDGAVVLGQSYYSDGHSEPFVWTEAGGVSSLRDLLAASNVDISGWQNLQAEALSNDGNTIVGRGTNPSGKSEGWAIRLQGNRPPIAVIGYGPQYPQQYIEKRKPVSFWATDSTDPDGDDLFAYGTYHWDFGDGTTSLDPIVTHTYAEAGNYTVTLVVNDRKADSAPATVVVGVGNTQPIANAGGPYGGTRNGIRFDGTASTDRDNDPLTYIWDFGDGTTGSGPNPTHAYAKSGTYTVTLIVNDGSINSSPSRAQVTVSNTAPIARLSGPTSGLKSSVLTWDGSGSSDADGDTLTYHWDFGDGSNLTSSTPTTTHSYAKSGSYRVLFTVNDGEKRSSLVSADVTIQNRLPVASIAYSPEAPFKTKPISFSGTGSTDLDGDQIVNYRWNFGDGTTAVGPVVSHTYASPWDYTVTLVVSNGTDNSVPATVVVSVTDPMPIANAGGPYNGAKNIANRLDATASTDALNRPLTYAWDFGDGNTGSGASPMHTYTSNGTYTVMLTVHNGTGRSIPATTQVTITNTAPVAKVSGPATGFRSSVLTWDGSGSSDTNGDTLSYRWDFGDGSTLTTSTPTATHSYATEGSYRVTLTVNDGETSSSPVSVDVTIQNRPPIAKIDYSPQELLKRKPISFSGTGSTDPDGDAAVNHRWDFGDGTTAVGPTVSHTYAEAGSYTVTLLVSDGKLDSASATTVVTVLNQTPIANAGGPYSGVKNAAIRFDGTASTDADGDPLTYTWNFGDGTTGSGTNPMHTYAASGTYTVTLTVNDGITNSIPAGAQVTVNNTAPIARVSGPATGFKSSVLTWDGSGSSDANGDTLTYHWDFGDGSSLISSTPTVTHSYTTIGSYLVTLVVSDGEMSSSPASADVSIQNQPPIANAGSDRTVTQRTTVKLNGSGSTDPDGKIVRVRWRQVAGPTVTLSGSTTLSPSFVAPRVSTTTKLTFELTVTDNDGVSSSDRVDVNVTRR